MAWLRKRVIPCLLLNASGGLVKTVKFRDPKYVGDPINAVRIFNDKEVDELIVLDIKASVEGRGPAFGTLHDIVDECFMPLAYGGGIRSVDDARAILSMGVEKVVLNSHAVGNPKLVEQVATEFGSQAVVVSIDTKKKLFGGYDTLTMGGSKRTGHDPVALARRMESAGAGELFINAIDRDGTMQGYDIDLVASVCTQVQIPVIAAGGARAIDDLRQVLVDGHASAAAAGSMFVFTGPHRAVLITYPNKDQLKELWYV